MLTSVHGCGCSTASVSTPGTPANAAVVSGGDARKLNQHLSGKPPGSAVASAGPSRVQSGKTEEDDSHHVTASEQAGTQLATGHGGEGGGSGDGGGNGSVQLSGEEVGPLAAETEQDSQELPAEQEEKSRSSDSQSLTPSEDSDADAKSEARSGRSHRLGSFLSIGSKSTDPFSDDVHDQFVGVGHCRFKAPRCFKHMRFPSTLEPHSKIYVSWLFLVTLAFMYNAVVIPLRGVFPYQTAENLRYWLAADYVCDLVYLLDIIVFKSRLRFINNGIDECARTETRKRYMEKWSFKNVGVNPWLRLPRILKVGVPPSNVSDANVAYHDRHCVGYGINCDGDVTLADDVMVAQGVVVADHDNVADDVMVAQGVVVADHDNVADDVNVAHDVTVADDVDVADDIQSYWEFYERCDEASRSSAHAIRIIKTMTYMLFLIHIETCGYYAVSSYEGIASNHWVYQGHGIAYIRCFYLATKTATSIGNNPKPTNELEYIFMTLYWLSGVFVFALLIGQIRDIVEAAGNVKDNYRKKMDSCHWYMQSINLPQELKDRVRQWFLYNWDQQKTIGACSATLDERSLVSSLPKKLQADLAINVHFNTLSKVRLFQDCERNLLYDLVLKLKPILFLPGDYICRKGEVGKEMYIVSQGEVEVLGGEHNDTVLATLREGSVFGEISLLAMSGGGNRRTADVRCKGYTNVFTLSKHDFQLAMMEYPEAQAVLKKRAKSNLLKVTLTDELVRQNKSSLTTTAVIETSWPFSIRKLLKLNARLERRFKKSKAVETVSSKHYQDSEELIQETSLVTSTLIQVTDPDQNVVQQMSTSSSNNFFDIQPRIMTRSHSQRLNSPGPSLANRLAPSRSRSYREGLALSALGFGKNLTGGLAKGYSSASLRTRATSNKHLYESDDDSSSPMADDPFDELSLSEMLHGSSASSSFEDDAEDVEIDKGDGDSSIDKSLKTSEKQALIRPPSFKKNLKSFCKAIQGEEYEDRVPSKISPTQLKSPLSDGYRPPSCLATGKGNTHGAICGQSIVDGGTRADFFHVDAMGASFLGEFYFDNARPSAKSFSPKSVSFSDGSKTSYSDSFNNNNCNSSCQSSLMPKNKVHPTTESLLAASSDAVASPKDEIRSLQDKMALRDQMKIPRTGCDPSPACQPNKNSSPKEAKGLPSRDFNDVFEVFHDSQSDLTCCTATDFQPNLPQQPSAKSSSFKSKKKYKGNEIDKYVQQEKAGEARYLARVLPSEILLATSPRTTDDSRAACKDTAQNKVTRDRLTAVSFDEDSPSSVSQSEHRGSHKIESSVSGCAGDTKSYRIAEKVAPEEKHKPTALSSTRDHFSDASSSSVDARVGKTSRLLDHRERPHVSTGDDQAERDQPQASRLLEMLSPCTSTALLATGLEMAGCGGYGAITTTPLPSSPSPKIFLSSSSTSPTSSSSSPSRPCTTFFPSTPTGSNGSPPSLNLSAASSPRSSFSSTFSPMKMSNLCFSYPSPMSSTPNSSQKNVSGFSSIGTDKVSQATAPTGNEVSCEPSHRLTTFETVSPNKSPSPKPAFKVSPLRCNTPLDSPTDGSFSKPSFQAPLSNGLTNCCDRSAQQITPVSINKRVVFVPDPNKPKGVITSASDIHSTRQNFPLSSTGNIGCNHKPVVDVSLRNHMTINNSISAIPSLKTTNKSDADLYRQKETSL
ncbi:cyclic nucleotide-gated cation channel [Elysia marginata]|uniref:Cyclic nucleotide-gated cation channel n=1 Tax=Elysia marginata TaxID=1093978 RepID=A0AAV4HTA2_9GAST|nr:cyclic nucleotide-gated cation channel [Elysia marginata]